jgi:small subunit ribosomal protein S6
MRKYEGLFILRPNLSEDELGKLSTAVVEVIAKNNGKVDRKEDMGIRDLAYQIKKEKKGRYLLVYFTAEPNAISAIEKAYKLNESVLRSVIFEHEEK